MDIVSMIEKPAVF